MGNNYKNVKVVGYSFYINTDDKSFDIIVMDKDKDYVFEGMLYKEIEKEKITENATKAVYVLKEKDSSYNDYKDILNSIKLK